MDVVERNKQMKQWNDLDQQGKAIGACPSPIFPGQEVTKVFQPPRMSVFWSKDIKEKEGVPQGDGLFYVEMVVIDRMFDLSKNSYALNETIRTLIKVFVPFSVLIVMSLLTKRDDRKLVERFYVKMRTPVTVDRKMDGMELEKSYLDPNRFKERLLFPNSELEFFKWKKADALGFILIVLGVFGIVGMLYLLLHIGA
jgi:SSS family solute:Na+ symporter